MLKTSKTRAWQGSRPITTVTHRVSSPCQMVTPVISGVKAGHARDRRPWPRLEIKSSTPTAVTVFWWWCLAITASITPVMEEWCFNHGRDSQEQGEERVQECSRPLLVVVMDYGSFDHAHDQLPGCSYVLIFQNKIRKAYSMPFYPRVSAYMI